MELKFHPEDNGEPLKHFRHRNILIRCGFWNGLWQLLKRWIYGGDGETGAGKLIGLHTDQVRSFFITTGRNILRVSVSMGKMGQIQETFRKLNWERIWQSSLEWLRFPTWAMEWIILVFMGIGSKWGEGWWDLIQYSWFGTHWNCNVCGQLNCCWIHWSKVQECGDKDLGDIKSLIVIEGISIDKICLKSM